jgi:hypothetical protein
MNILDRNIGDRNILNQTVETAKNAKHAKKESVISDQAVAFLVIPVCRVNTAPFVFSAFRGSNCFFQVESFSCPQCCCRKQKLSHALIQMIDSVRLVGHPPLDVLNSETRCNQVKFCPDCPEWPEGLTQSENERRRYRSAGVRLLYRGFPIRRLTLLNPALVFPELSRLEAGDTAGWKPALRRLWLCRAVVYFLCLRQ